MCYLSWLIEYKCVVRCNNVALICHCANWVFLMHINQVYGIAYYLHYVPQGMVWYPKVWSESVHWSGCLTEDELIIERVKWKYSSKGMAHERLIEFLWEMTVTIPRKGWSNSWKGQVIHCQWVHALVHRLSYTLVHTISHA